MPPTFHQADRKTYHRVIIVGSLFCAAFMAISLALRPQTGDKRVVVKADRLVKTAGDSHSVH
jgi:hypothetical protein